MKYKFDKSVIEFLEHVHNIRDYIIFSNITPAEVDIEIRNAIYKFIKTTKME